MVSRREEDERERARLDETYGPPDQPSIPVTLVSGAVPASHPPMSLTRSASAVVQQFRESETITLMSISKEGATSGFEHRGVVLLDDTGPHLRLWMRPAVDKHEGVVDAEWRSRTYPDVAVLRLRDTDDGACELVVGWELHPKSQAHVRYQYARAAFGLVAAVAIFVIATDAIALVAILMALLAIYSAKQARDISRPAFDAVAAVERVLATADKVEEVRAVAGARVT